MMRDLFDDTIGHDEMTLDDYQSISTEFCFYTGALFYPTLGLCGESGEFAEKVKKLHRDEGLDFTADEMTDQLDTDDAKALALELGDVLFYVSACANDIGYSLEEIAHMNIDKLESRKRRNRLRGSGDNR